jgi:hypothetical protein
MYSAQTLGSLFLTFCRISRNYRIHLRKILDGNAHPDAQVPVIELEQDHEDPTISYSLQVLGSLETVSLILSRRYDRFLVITWVSYS